MKRFWIKKGLMMIACFIAAFIAFGAIVMGLWNAVLPEVTGVKTISFVQALGILVLSKILFGGFANRGGWKRGGTDWKNNMREKFVNMTPEEREKFKAEWKNRCGGMGWRMDRKENSQSGTE